MPGIGAFYNSTNGAGWTYSAGWLQTNTPCTWYGVSCGSDHITGLGLRNNYLAGIIPSELGSLIKLNWLDLSTNQLAGSIPPELGNLANLRELILAGNQLVGTIPAQLGNLINIWSIWLSI